MTGRRLVIREETADRLEDYGRIPIAFDVREVLDAEAHALDGIALRVRPVEQPYVKDYDAVDGEGPAAWAARFDLRCWGILAAWSDGRPVGGAAIAFDTPGVEMLRGRRDLALLWDLRVAPLSRGRGVGRALFTAAEQWAASRGARWLAVETQNVNVPACRLYHAMGCTLGEIDRHAYPELPDEVRLVWWKRLGVA